MIFPYIIVTCRLRIQKKNIESTKDGRKELKLVIDQTTETWWRSFIAWEHHKNKSMSGSSFERRSTCTSTAMLFGDLICCPGDVQLLKDRGIIVDELEKSNRDLVAFFHSIAMGIDRDIIDPIMHP